MAKAPEALVVDASALLPLVLPDTPERKRYTLTLIDLAEAGGTRLIVPQFCHAEMAAAIMKALRTPSIALSQDSAVEFFDIVEQLGVETVVDSYNLRDICNFAQRVGCQAADSIYLRLAQLLGVGIASLDGGMLQGARALKLHVFAAPASTLR